MKSAAIVGVQPEVLRWARESIGKSPEDVARALKRPARDIEAWERGDKVPTYAQLEKLAYKVYKRPLAVFFFPRPPEEKDPKSEFRTLPYEDLKDLAPDTYLHIRRARAYQLSLRELFGNASPNPDPVFRSVALSKNASVVEQAAIVRSHLGISLEQQNGWRDDEFALKQWRSSIERAGIFVFKNTFKQKTISGFSLSDDCFPLIYLNNSTTKTRQIFSLFHELAHLLLQMNGIGKIDRSYVKDLPGREQKTELFCNALAAEILIPVADFERQTSEVLKNIEGLPNRYFAELAERYGVSREAVLRRFLDQGRVEAGFYERKAKEWSAQQKPAGGGNYYRNVNAYLSESFAREVVRRYYRRQLTLEQASEYLGIKTKSFENLEQHLLQGVEA